MNTKIRIIATCLLSAMVLPGCSTWRKLNGTEKGAVIGGGTGAVVGEVVAPGGGGALGAVGGGLIGREEDRGKKRRK